jgi:hypothetical protein
MARKRTTPLAPSSSPVAPDDDGGAVLSAIQRHAIEHLASGKTDVETASLLDLNANTISRWRRGNPIFSDAERAAEDEAVARTRRRLRSLTARAVDTIASVMDGKRTDPATGEESFNADPQHRLAAAKTVLDRAGVAELKGVELTGANGGPVALDVRATLLEAAKGLTDAELFPEEAAEPKP